MGLTAMRLSPLVSAALLAIVAAAPPVHAQDALDRLRDLAAPDVPDSAAIYADEIAADLALIAALGPALFDPARPGAGPAGAPVDIVLFTGPDCAECAAARDDLAALADRLGIRAGFADIGGSAADAAMMTQLNLDLLPSYVMADGLIRGRMPVSVLETYLTP